MTYNKSSGTVMFNKFITNLLNFKKIRDVYKIQYIEKTVDYKYLKNLDIAVMTTLLMVFAAEVYLNVTNSNNVLLTFLCLLLIAFLYYCSERISKERKLHYSLEDAFDEKTSIYQKFTVCCALVEADTKEKINMIDIKFSDECNNWKQWRDKINTLLLGIFTTSFIPVIQSENGSIAVAILSAMTFIAVILFIYRRYGYKYKNISYYEFEILADYFNFYRIEKGIEKKIKDQRKALIAHKG